MMLINALFKLKKKPISDFNVKNAGINYSSVRKNTIKNTIHHRSIQVKIKYNEKTRTLHMCCLLSDSIES